MKIANLSVALMAASLFVAASAFAQSATKQKTQEGGSWGGQSCDVVANPAADPECKTYKQKTQNLTPSPVQAAQEATGSKR
jgi:hypothetical protein